MGYNARVRRAGVYIHIPFCERKCTYCNFNTTDFFEVVAARYVAAVRDEIAWWGRTMAGQSSAEKRTEIDTIYFGGGTPSLIEAQQIVSLVKACRAAFEVSPDAEITIEINPATLAPPKLETWLRGGINRASVGVQSFIDRELVSLSRTHTASAARRTIEVLRQAGFNNISLDLIAGLPEQTLEDWEWNLRQALDLEPEHMSLYLLEVKEGTQLFSQIKRGQRPSPDEDLAGEMYRLMCDAARASGYEQYEISNFAMLPDASDRRSAVDARDDRPGSARALASTSDHGTGAEGGGRDTCAPSLLRSKHNLKYWTGAAFYGMGCGAHSYDGRSRWMNTRKTEHYIEQVATSGHAVSERRELGPEERASDALFMGLRLSEGIDLNAFCAEYEVDVLQRYASEFPELFDARLIEVNDGRLMLTEAGRLMSNEVFVHFV
ncbi:MAG TPA: coproporphyrinogen-III oxidase family protein [Blastocatellia bacterium]|nr:coproporphyrinogen-III oxidase family protein [Blastocatellia bacterium]